MSYDYLFNKDNYACGSANNMYILLCLDTLYLNKHLVITWHT